MVLSVFSLVSLVLHARRAQKIWPGIFVRNRNRNARGDTEMTRAVAVPEVPFFQDEAFYQEMRAKIAERKERLFHDKSVAEAFQLAVETISRQVPAVGQQPVEILPLAA